MRILHVNKFVYRRGGAEAYMLDLAEIQRRRGHDVAVFGMAHPDNPPLPHSALFPSYLELNPAPERPVDRLRAASRILYSVHCRRQMGAMLDQFRPDVVHAHNVYQQLSPSVLSAATARGIPTVLTLHDFKLVCPTYLLLDHGHICEACIDGGFHHAVTRRCKDDSVLASSLLAAETAFHRWAGLYDQVDAVVCPSHFLAERIQRAGLFDERVHVLGNFVIDSAESRPRDGAVVCVSRLSQEKGVDLLLEAVARTRNVTSVDIAGDGPALKRLQDRASEISTARITLHGQVPRGRVHQLLEQAAVAVVPSRCYENQPLAVLEAFSHGVPVVGSALGGISELLQDGQCGRLVRPNDPVALAQAIDDVLSHPDRAAAMGRAGQRRARSEFSPDGHAERLERIYEHVRHPARKEQQWSAYASR